MEQCSGATAMTYRHRPRGNAAQMQGSGRPTSPKMVPRIRITLLYLHFYFHLISLRNGMGNGNACQSTNYMCHRSPALELSRNTIARVAKVKTYVLKALLFILKIIEI